MVFIPRVSTRRRPRSIETAQPRRFNRKRLKRGSAGGGSTGGCPDRSFGRNRGISRRPDQAIPYNIYIKGGTNGAGAQMKVKELRRAYATLGLDDNATLTEARDAYLAWVGLLGDGIVVSENE